MSWRAGDQTILLFVHQRNQSHSYLAPSSLLIVSLCICTNSFPVELDADGRTVCNLWMQTKHAHVTLVSVPYALRKDHMWGTRYSSVRYSRFFDSWNYVSHANVVAVNWTMSTQEECYSRKWWCKCVCWSVLALRYRVFNSKWVRITLAKRSNYTNISIKKTNRLNA